LTSAVGWSVWPTRPPPCSVARCDGVRAGPTGPAHRAPRRPLDATATGVW
jgi:hypothetical protein